MLAFMPRASAVSHFHPPPSLATDSMSLALLRSTPVAYNQQSAFPTSPSPSKKPKLSLNTANVIQGTTSLRLETLSATSPTAINTFQNRDGGKSPDGVSNQARPILSLLKTDFQQSSTASPSQIALPASTDTPTLSTSPMAFSPNAFFPTTAPYTLPINTTSILTNGPIPRRASSASNSTQQQQTQPATPPPQKKVSFREQLTEDIKNTEFTLRHSDIEEAICTLKSNDETQVVDANAALDKTKMPIRSGSKRDSVELETSESCPATPVAGRAKRHKWVWTLENDRSPALTEPVEC